MNVLDAVSEGKPLAMTNSAKRKRNSDQRLPRAEEKCPHTKQCETRHKAKFVPDFPHIQGGGKRQKEIAHIKRGLQPVQPEGG